MKKILSAIMILALTVSLAACGSSKVTPRDALTNTTNAKQGKAIISMSLNVNTGSGPEDVKLILNSVFGKSEDDKKIGLESTINAIYQGKTLEARIGFNGDFSEKEPKVSIEAGAPAETLNSFGLAMPSAMVVSINEADFKKLLKLQNVDFNKAVNADTIKKNAEALDKILKAFNELKIEEPKDAGSGSMTVEGKTFEGEKYTVHVKDDQIKGAIKALAKIGMDMQKAEAKNNGAAGSLDIPSEAEVNKQLDEAFKTIDIKNGLDITLIVDKNGYLSYMGAIMDMKDPAGASEIKMNIALGYIDLDSSVKGMEYYNKNKTGMYKNATVIPIMQYLGGAGN